MDKVCSNIFYYFIFIFASVFISNSNYIFNVFTLLTIIPYIFIIKCLYYIMQ